MQVWHLTASTCDLPLQVGEHSDLLFQFTFQDIYFPPNINDMKNPKNYYVMFIMLYFKRMNSLTNVSIRINLAYLQLCRK